MSEHNKFKVLSNLDHPKRVLGLTIDELVIAVIATVLIIVSSNKLVVLFCSMGLFFGLKRLKQNRGPRFLLVLAYWCLPQPVTRFFLPKMQDSSKRFWMS